MKVYRNFTRYFAEKRSIPNYSKNVLLKKQEVGHSVYEIAFSPAFFTRLKTNK